MEIGPVLEGIRACDGTEAHDAVFLEFMAAKRRQGFDGQQTAMIATLTGAAGGMADEALLACTPEGASLRAELIDDMRPRW